jgi:argininosuccinate synthase
VRIDGIEGMPEVIASLNVAGGLNGIGLIDIIEDGIMGLKSREIYEAPAAEIILGLHRDLEHLCLTKEELEFKSLVDRQWSYLVYHGKAFHPLKAALDDFISRTQQFVDGVVTAELYKGNVRILRRESESGLFDGHLRTVERESFDQRAMESVVEAFAISSRSLHRRSSERSVSALASERMGGQR